MRTAQKNAMDPCMYGGVWIEHLMSHPPSCCTPIMWLRHAAVAPITLPPKLWVIMNTLILVPFSWFVSNYRRPALHFCLVVQVGILTLLV